MQYSRFTTLLLAASLCALLQPAARAGGLAPDLTGPVPAAHARREVQVIVRLRPGTAGNLPTLARRGGGRLLRALPAADGALMRLPRHQLRRMADQPEVAWISPDRPVVASSVSASPEVDLDTSGIDQVWNRRRQGDGVGIAILDTGVSNDLRNFGGFSWLGNRIAGWRDLVNGRSFPYDDSGHGTHVAGIALGEGTFWSRPALGVSPRSHLVAVKVLDRQGRGHVSDVIEGIDWVLRRRRDLNIRVLNISFGQPPAESYLTDPLCIAVRRAVNSGIVVVCSAGNLGLNPAGEARYGGITSPANDPNVITVGAQNTRGTVRRSDDTVAGYSSRGPTRFDQLTKPDLVAPGNRIVSARAPGSLLDALHPGNRRSSSLLGLPLNDRFELSGTSMAAPHVAGIAALLLEANPGLRPTAVKAVLMYTARPISLTTAEGPLPVGLSVLTQGAGSVNGIGALEVVQRLDARATVGSDWLVGALQPVSLIGGEVVQWGEQVLQGQQVIWGPDIINIKQILWEGELGWADPVVWAEQVIWIPDGADETPAAPVWQGNNIWTDPLFDPLGPEYGLFKATILVQGE